MPIIIVCAFHSLLSMTPPLYLSYDVSEAVCGPGLMNLITGESRRLDAFAKTAIPFLKLFSTDASSCTNPASQMSSLNQSETSLSLLPV